MRLSRLALAAALTFIPALADADKARPKAASRPPTQEELNKILAKIVAKPFNPPVAKIPSLGDPKMTVVRDWRIQTAGSIRLPDGGLRADFRVTNAGPTPLPETNVKYTCAVKKVSPPYSPKLSSPWVGSTCQGASSQVSALQPGESMMVFGGAHKLGVVAEGVNLAPGVQLYILYASKITATVDPNNAVQEWNENNNSAGWTWDLSE
jgi:hypothetical protein